MKSSYALAALSLTLLASSAPAAHAGDFWSGVGKLGEAVLDVGTAGEYGRNRKRQFQEADERVARQAREDAETLHRSQIAAKKEQEIYLTKTKKSYEEFRDSLVEIGSDTDYLVSSAKKELAGRTWMKTAILPSLKKLVGMDVDYNDEVLSALQDLAREAAEPAANSGNADADLDANQASARRSSDAIRRLQDVSRAHGVEMNRMVAEAIARSSTEQAEAMLAALVGTQAKITKLREKADSEINDTERDLKVVSKALHDLGA